jgi:CheY-like chemotaxis protein
LSTAEGRRRVLLVEDEALVAMLIEDALLDLDCDVVTTAAQLEHAMAAAMHGSFDVAILDVNLAGKMTYPVARVLRDRATPFIFVTGYGAGGLDPEYAHCPVLQKPFRRKELATALSQALRPDPS